MSRERHTRRLPQVARVSLVSLPLCLGGWVPRSATLRRNTNEGPTTGAISVSIAITEAQVGAGIRRRRFKALAWLLLIRRTCRPCLASRSTIATSPLDKAHCYHLHIEPRSRKMAQATKKDCWSSQVYQHSASFVPKLAGKVVDWLEVNKDDIILSIGCGGKSPEA